MQTQKKRHPKQSIKAIANEAVCLSTAISIPYAENRTTGKLLVEEPPRFPIVVLNVAANQAPQSCGRL